jgi:hypothetical protein
MGNFLRMTNFRIVLKVYVLSRVFTLPSWRPRPFYSDVSIADEAARNDSWLSRNRLSLHIERKQHDLPTALELEDGKDTDHKPTEPWNLITF